MAIIYTLTNIINNKVYVGKTTVSLSTRIRQHINKSVPSDGCYIHNAINKYGFDNFYLESFEVSDDLVNIWERHLIKRWNTKIPFGYNMTEGGEGLVGFKHSLETRRLLSDLKKGSNPWNKNRPRSEETKLKISLANSNPSNETRQKMSESHKGHTPWNKGKKFGPLSEDTRNKISLSSKGGVPWNTGKNLTKDHKRKIALSNLKRYSRVYEVEFPNGEVIKINNLKLFSRENNLDSGSMYKVALGKQKHHKGYRIRILTGV